VADGLDGEMVTSVGVGTGGSSVNVGSGDRVTAGLVVGAVVAGGGAALTGGALTGGAGGLDPGRGGWDEYPTAATGWDGSARGGAAPRPPAPTGALATVGATAGVPSAHPSVTANGRPRATIPKKMYLGESRTPRTPVRRPERLRSPPDPHSFLTTVRHRDPTSTGGIMVSSARLRPLAAVAAALVFGSTACSAAPHRRAETPGVATLGSAAPSPSATPARPRERIDDTPEDYERLAQPYTDCLDQHGVGIKDTRKGTNAPAPKTVADAAHEACDHLLPLPPWEKDPANPESKDFFRDVVKCLRNKGIKYVEVVDGGYALGGPQNDQRSITKGMDLAPGCEREVAATMKK
jgi:hypothetical protein